MFGGEHFGSPLRSPERRGESCIHPLCLDSHLYPKVAAPPRYFVYFPLGFANGSSFKGALLIQDHALLVRGAASLGYTHSVDQPGIR